MILPVILAGGSGTRLWPLSRTEHPKQFLNLINDSSLLENTLERVSSNNFLAPFVLCHQSHRFTTAEQLRLLNLSNASLLLEPESKNTAPALALAAFNAIKMHDDPVMVVLSADHSLSDVKVFEHAVMDASLLAERGYLVSLGVPASHPETGYGYIKKGEALNLANGYAISQFVEKPSFALAESFVASQQYLFNTGIFAFKASTFLQELKKFCPDIYQYCEMAVERSRNDLDFIRVDEGAFSKTPCISIDYAIMEKTKRAAVVPLNTPWSDIGSYASLWQACEQDSKGNVIKGDVIALDSTNSLITSENKLVTTLGVDNLVIVDTKDALLVTTKVHAQQVKTLVDTLAHQNRPELATHREVYRPWGKYDTLDDGENFLVKRVSVKPGEQLSLQKHSHRAEHWIVVKGQARATINERTHNVHANESVYIPIGAVHRLENVTDELLELIEVQTGEYLSEDDIIRLEDKYNRGLI